MIFRKLMMLSVLAAATVASAGSGDANEAKPRSDAILTMLNSRAAGSSKSFAEAAEIVAEDAREGRPLQQFVLAVLSRDADIPSGVRLSDADRVSYLDASRDKIRALAEKKGNALAWYLLSLEGNDRTMLRRAAEGGNIQAMNAWGTLTLTEALQNFRGDTNEVQQVLLRSCGYFKKAADESDANGLCNLGMCYLNGFGYDKDLEKAYECFKKAAEAGHAEAINNLGGFYRDGLVVLKDLPAAARWFARSAALDNVYGMLNLGLALQRGEGVDRDAEKAVGYFKRASDRGCVEAVNAYAMCLFNGDGIAEDKAGAVLLYRRAAERGYPPAMENLAYCYECGFGGLARDAKTATVWKVRARAAMGDLNATAWLRENGY